MELLTYSEYRRSLLVLRLTLAHFRQEGLIGGHGLTSIPPSIAELNNLVILPTTEAPAPSPPKGPPLTYPRERIFSRSHTVPAAHPGNDFLGPTSPRLAKSSSLLNINGDTKPGFSIAGLRMYLEKVLGRSGVPEVCRWKFAAWGNIFSSLHSVISPQKLMMRCFGRH